VGAPAGPPGTVVSPTTAVRGRRLLILAFSLPLLTLGGRSGGTAAPAPEGLDAFLLAVFPADSFPAGFLPAGVELVGAGPGRRTGAAAFLPAEGDGFTLPPFPAFFLPVAPGVPVGATLTGGDLAGGDRTRDRSGPLFPGRGTLRRGSRA